MKNYSNEPISIGEIKANKSTNSMDWTARDCLIELLRKIDSGEINITSMVVCFKTDDSNIYHSSQGLENTTAFLGLLEFVKMSAFDEIKGD